MRQRKQIQTDFRNMDRYKTISRNAPIFGASAQDGNLYADDGKPSE